MVCTEAVTTGLRDALTYCYRCKGRTVTLSDHDDIDDNKLGDFDYNHEIRSRAMEKRRQKPRMGTEKLTYRPINECNNERDEAGEVFSARSSVSECCMSVEEGYMTAKTEFSRCSSLTSVELENQWNAKENRKLSVIQEFCHCQGWPFGLGRKAALLPPLPKSPAESWSWRKPNRVAPIPFI